MMTAGIGKHTPDFGQLVAALTCQRDTSFVPLAELFIDPGLKETVLGRRIADLRSEVDFWLTAGYDYVLMHFPTMFLFRPDVEEGVKYNLAKLFAEPPPQPNEKKGFIANWAEFDRFPWPDPERIDLSVLDEVKKYLPDGMKVISGTSGFYEQIWMLMGFDCFNISLYEQPDLVSAVFTRIGETVFAVWKRIADRDCVGALWLGDDVGYSEGLMVHPDVLRKHTHPWMAKMGQYCRAKGKPFIYHSDGKITEIIPDLVGLGVNALHPIEPKAMDIFELKSSIGKRVCLIGNLDLDRLLTRGTPEEVDRGTRYLIERLAPGGGYVLGSSNCIAHFVPPGNYIAMLRARNRYGCFYSP
jgi:uroporphyrinogen decarboxylase